VTRLVLVHGRDNQGLDADALERTWLTVLRAGLAEVGSDARPGDADASFVYYGDALAGLVDGDGDAPPVTVHALTLLPDDELAFVAAVAEEVLHGAGVDVAALRDAVGRAEGVDLGGAVRAWLGALLSALDRYVPGLSSGVVVLLAHDVWTYLHDPDARRALDDALAAAMPVGEPAVVVAHSFGSVIAYAVLREHANAARWDVPLLLTLGSPLAIRAIRDVLAAGSPLRVPAPVRRWVAARDPRDALALHGLGPEAFPLDPPSPAVETLVVENHAPGNHSAAVLLDDGTPAGYLAAPAVARAVADALGG